MQSLCFRSSLHILLGHFEVLEDVNVTVGYSAAQYFEFELIRECAPACDEPVEECASCRRLLSRRHDHGRLWRTQWKSHRGVALAIVFKIGIVCSDKSFAASTFACSPRCIAAVLSLSPAGNETFEMSSESEDLSHSLSITYERKMTRWETSSSR